MCGTIQASQLYELPCKTYQIHLGTGKSMNKLNLRGGVINEPTLKSSTPAACLAPTKIRPLQTTCTWLVRRGDNPTILANGMATGSITQALRTPAVASNVHMVYEGGLFGNHIQTANDTVNGGKEGTDSKGGKASRSRPFQPYQGCEGDVGQDATGRMDG